MEAAFDFTNQGPLIGRLLNQVIKAVIMIIMRVMIMNGSNYNGILEHCDIRGSFTQMRAE